MFEYDLIDGVVVDGVRVKNFSIKNLSPSESKNIQNIASAQYKTISSSKNFKVVNDKHALSIEGLIYLNEHTAASIAKLGEEVVSLSFSDLCGLGVTAQDWQVILSASMAVEEYFNCASGELLA
ncbi:hypothetical protein [Shewanella khirikhana]|uniref:Uncharacterized protein n=1 Tax=Shewanella khirikhana TaxID=1965282 RepID=A0ABN5TST7_9GAMM|nr:hypothetical protein [Shewanella khirikhana]AZQ10121.1 hypothetical protein STH12_00985 [Shewanella khirikhana]